MNQIKVDVLEPSRLQALIDALDSPLRVRLIVVQLGREEDFGTGGRGARDEVVDRAAAVGFVLVPLGAVDVLCEV